MMEHLANDSHHFKTSIVIIIGLLLLVAGLAITILGRKMRGSHGKYVNFLPVLGDPGSTKTDDIQHLSTAHDTFFVLPDISNYTRFIASSPFSATKSQEIVFGLLNAMIGSCDDTFELSKLEGDAVLFYCDARTHSKEQLERALIAIFDAFFETKQKIMSSENCAKAGRKSLDDLDLKIFVHRGDARRFNFRGSIDHFGADVIILHRLLKNNINGTRYIMVTDAASELVSFQGGFTSEKVNENLPEIGSIQAVVYRILDHARGNSAAVPNVVKV